MYSTTYEYSWTIARRLFFRDLWRRQRGALLALALLAVIAAVSYRSDSEWFSGLAAGAVLLYLAFLIGSYRQARRIATVYAGVPLTVTISDASLTVAGDAIEAQCAWRMFGRLERDPEGLILTRRDTLVPVFIPTASLPAEAVELVARQVRLAGGHVADGV